MYTYNNRHLTFLLADQKHNTVKEEVNKIRGGQLLNYQRFLVIYHVETEITFPEKKICGNIEKNIRGLLKCNVSLHQTSDIHIYFWF